MTRFIDLRSFVPKKIRSVDEKLVSYNIEMTEITGGTFWKAYTREQIEEGKSFEISAGLENFTALEELMQYYPPIDLYDEKLRYLAHSLGAAWIRVSGSWATKTYYDFEGKTGGKPPKGYQSVLTEKQWMGVLDFVKAVNGKLLISVSNCEGDHKNGGALDLAQTEKIFDFSHKYGVDIDAAEFMNEPNMLEFSGAPKGYTAKDYARDLDIFNGWVRKNYPKCLIVGPCTTGDTTVGRIGKHLTAGIGNLMKTATTEELLWGTRVPLDVFSYHYYNGISERLAQIMPSAHWSADEAHTDEYLGIARENAEGYAVLRDRYVPGGQMWVTESGDAGGGGNTWASTYLDVPRTLSELGAFAAVSDGIIFHNTLASSDYGFLERESFAPRPNYFAVLLWNRLMGNEVYDCSALNGEGLHVYCHSSKKGNRLSYLIINNSKTDIASVEIGSDAERYTLSGGGKLRSPIAFLNDKALSLDEKGRLPELDGKKERAGRIELPPCTCSFLTV